MKLYKDYCYPDLDAVANTIRSEVYLADHALVQSVTVNATDLTLNVLYTDTQTTASHNVAFPECSVTGYQKSFLGISFEESQELSWLIALVLITAFSIKSLKRGL